MRRSLSLLGVCALGVAIAGTSPAVGASPAPEAKPTDAGIDSSTVTLITGHRLRVDAVGDGRHAVTALPAPDGTRANLKVVERDEGLYVIPTEAQPYLAADSLDRELFNVTGLIEQGYDDGNRDSLPLIVTYAGGTAARMAAEPPVPEHTIRTATLESVGAVAVTSAKDEAAAFWSAVADDLGSDAGGTRRATPAIEKIWLDGRVSPTLAESVPQVGAPAAWQAGYDGTGVTVAVLDTGYDPDHSDLTGQVSLAQDFSGTSVQDVNGHGTHVAATVAGTGAASGGDRLGVAPGAELMIGKVIGDDGTGQNSWLIEGMEWAVSQGADIVSMSLSSEVTDGSDPLSQAVDSLSATSGTLFVAAAGNEGPGPQTVRAPGVADAALSVGAVDKSDVLAGFSSRGPRFGNSAVKPEITAPGVGIVAARAAGTSLGDPVDANYTSLNGTSMATPHVSGAAAILLQRHPDWQADELKQALMQSSAALDDYTVYEQGAGRLDVARAVTQTTFADTGTVNFGSYDWPHDGTDPAVARTITYTNDSADPITLDISVEVTGDGGSPAAAGMFALSTTSVTVPAGGSAPVELTLDPNLGDPDLYGGRVTARSADGTTSIHTAVGVFKEPETIEVTVEGIAHDGQPAGGSSSAELWSLDTDYWGTGLFGRKGGGSGPATFRVQPGTYSLLGFLFTQDEARLSDREVAVTGDTELVLTEDTHIVLDGRDATRIAVDTPDPTEHQGLTLGYYRSSERHMFNLHYLFDQYMDVAYAEPTDPIERGEFEFTSWWELLAPELDLRVGSAPVPAEYAIGSPKVDGRHGYPVVDAGTATAADLTGLDLAGAAALVRRSDEIGLDEQVAAVAAAGAEAVIVHHDQPGWLLLRVSDGSPIPAVTISQADGAAILGRLAGGALTAEFDGIAVSPYLYDLMLPEPGRIPDSLDYRPKPKDLAELDTTYVATGPAHLGNEARHAFRPYDTFSLRLPREVSLPSRREEWVSAGDTRWQQFVWAERLLVGGMIEPERTYDAGETDPRAWFGPIVRPGVPADVDHYGQYGMPGFREADQFTILIRSFLDGHGNNGDGVAGDTSAARLYRDGALIAQRDAVYGTWPAAMPAQGDDPLEPPIRGLPAWNVRATAAQPAEYRLELDVSRDAPWWQRSTATRTAWTFTSSRPSAGERAMLPLLQVDYAIDTDVNGVVGDRARTRLELAVHQQGEPNRSDPESLASSAQTRASAGLKLWLSYDDGASWQQTRVTRRQDGTFTAMVDHRRGAAAVSLRVEAWDADGNRIEQTVERAYGLTTGR